MDILVGDRVLSAADPTVDGLQTFHDISPKSLTVSITIRGAQGHNDLAVQALLPRDLYSRDIVVEANGDHETNPDLQLSSYDGQARSP